MKYMRLRLEIISHNKSYSMKNTIMIIAVICITSVVKAQHQHNMDSMNMKQMNDTMPMNDSMMKMHDMNMHHEMMMPGMTHSFSLSLPMERNGSGTSWSPD